MKVAREISIFDKLRAVLQTNLAVEAGWSFFLKISATTLGFLVTVVLARTMGPETYGVYAYAYTLVWVLARPLVGGLRNLVLRETARGATREEPAWIKGIWRWSGLAAVAAGLILVLLSLLGVGLFSDQLTTTDWGVVVWGVLLVPLIALGNLRGAALRGLRRMIAGISTELVLQPALFLTFVAVWLFVLQIRLSASLAMALQVLAAALAFSAGSWLLWRHTPTAVKTAKPRMSHRAWLASALPFTLIAGMGVVNNRTDILVLGLFQDSGQVGIYRVAVQAATLTSLGLQAANLVVAPRFAQLYTRGDFARLQRVVTLSARGVLAFSAIATAFFVLFGQPFLQIVFGESYATGYTPLLILVIGQFINSSAGSVGFLLNMTGHEQDTVKGMAIAAALNVMLNLVLVPLLGTPGAALATSLSMIVWNVLLWWAVRKRLGINSLAFGFPSSQI